MDFTLIIIKVIAISVLSFITSVNISMNCKTNVPVQNHIWFALAMAYMCLMMGWLS